MRSISRTLLAASAVTILGVASCATTRHGHARAESPASPVAVAAGEPAALEPVSPESVSTAVAAEAAPADADGAPKALDTAPKVPAAPKAPAQAKAGAKVFELPLGCGPKGQAFACNPLTNAGCNAAAGEACDDDDKGGFTCYPGPNAVKEGGECNAVEGPSCGPGMGCDGASASDPDGECGKYCCADADCAPRQKCVAIDKRFGALGFCN